MRRKGMLLFLVLVLLAGLPLGASGTGEEEGKGITLRLAWWGNPTRDERTIKVVELYKSRHPEVNILTETTGWVGYWDKLAAQAAANDLPDIIQMDYSYIRQYGGKNLLADLTPFVDSGVIDLKGVDENLILGGKVGDKLYGINLGTNSWCLIYDPEVIQRAGLTEPSPTWTIDDFEAMAVTIYEKTGVQTIPFSTTDPRHAFENMLRQTGASFFDPATGASLGFTDPAVLETFFEVQLRLLKKGVLIRPDEAFVSTTPEEGAFARGRSWVEFLWSNQVVSAAAAAKRPIGVALPPYLPGAKRPGTYFKPSMFFSVAQSSELKEEAARFVNFFVTDIEANKILLAERGIPIVPAVRDALKAIVDPVNRQVFEYIELVGKGHNSPIDPPDPPGAGEVVKLFRTITQEVLYGVTDPKTAAKKFMDQANEILARNK
ncbi:ABC transporter substrate-binding protein [Spirochaeta thermophila]|uniref:Extracellular solute-binding protein, family 1 n=1 Tax=Winmispira thermophila (strain ATCC 49972 / DSM 6192 / RI 19.B1) TaxID=665571 RepID=E0RRY4_WINT6|nr:extracellular solute-binding protein [Spirochaeta thermophila]ADN01771.1 extracellular solute-binding protein, family 1 [Spirochaeta thermophila DSM 6192]